MPSHMNKTNLTTGGAARHCHVSSETVDNWIRLGELTAKADKLLLSSGGTAPSGGTSR